MNVKKYTETWIKIQNFPLDEPGSVINFSQKLGALQNWSPAFTKRVTDEYRRYIFLCCIAEYGASPSKIVDEAWHLHLTYTKSYWIDFCKNTLNKDIHHHPSKGGTDENHKHEEWYKETLQLYETVFGMAPPTDIWPRPEQYEPVTDIPEPVTGKRIMKWAVALIALPFLFIGISSETLLPFFLNGPEFLDFYLLFGFASFAAYLMVRWENKIALKEITEEHYPYEATMFQMAKFLFGKHRAVQTAIVDLIRKNLLQVDKDQRFIISNAGYVPKDKIENPLLVSLLKEENNTKISYEMIYGNWYRDEGFEHPSLQKLYEFAGSKRSLLKENIVFIALLATGVIRILQGFIHAKPVESLVIEMVLFSILFVAAGKFFSTQAIVYNRARALYKENIWKQKLYEDPVVAEFVLNGTDAIAGFAESYLLTSLFLSYTPWKDKYSFAEGTWVNSSCGSGGGCGGGGGGGGCGGGCGGGGCGGCGS